MNPYYADRIAREHADALMADAVAARLARRVRRERRAAASSSAGRGAVQAQRRAAARPGAAAVHFAAHPFVALGSWIAAGHL
jgi:hypothetical protein